MKGQGFNSPTVHTLLCVERNTTVIAQLVRASDMVSEGPGLEPPNRFVSLGLSHTEIVQSHPILQVFRCFGQDPVVSDILGQNWAKRDKSRRMLGSALSIVICVAK